MKYEELFSFYANIKKNKDDFFLVEQKMVSILLKTREWNQLNDNQKKKEREDKINWLTSKIYVSTEYPIYIYYEQSLIYFYDILILVIKKIEDLLLNDHSKTEFTEKEILLIRLYTILVYEMNLINSTYDLKKITHIQIDILDNLLINIIDSYDEYKLNDLKKSFEKMMNLYKSNPYNS